MIPSIENMNGAFSLAGMNAVITGGNRGLGAAIGEAFAQSGANVAILCRNMQKAAEEVEKIEALGVQCRAFECDVADFDSVRAAVAQVDEYFEGKIDILVNNAGIGGGGDLLDQPEGLEDWMNLVNIDFLGTVRMTYQVGKLMRDAGNGGCIINVTSNAGFMVNMGMGMSAYSSSKAAGNHFTHCMACEMAKYDIRVNAIAPGFTHTELGKHIPAEAYEYINQQTVTGRFGEPIEVGAMAVYLASPAAAQVTGHVAVIDGGYMLRC